MYDVTVIHLRAEYRSGCALGIGDAAPRLSWIAATEAPGWRQAAYEIEHDGATTGRGEDDWSVFVPWPGAPLASRKQVVARVRVRG
jgi:alpha-L-rhamnosidase